MILGQSLLVRGVSTIHIFRFASDFSGLYLQLSHARSAFRSDW